ncbi:ATP-binding protein [Paenibacillus piri]|nr:ATP-binding protein [Paenibacillus piri]
MNADQPSAVDGALDLRKWDAAAGRTVTLDGRWEFYPGVQLMHNDTQSGGSDKPMKFIHVPGSWNQSLQSDRNTPYGFGSYRLRIYVNPEQDLTYSIRIPSVRSSSELFVNGRLLAQSGQPAELENNYTARNVPYSASFTADRNGVIELVVQAANFKDPRSGGIVRSIKFGTENAINRETQFSMMMQESVAVTFLIHAVYALILFFMGNRDRKLLYFSLMVLCAILAILTGSEDKLLLYWFPINYDLSLKLMSLYIIVGTYSLIGSILHLLPAYWSTKFFPGYTALCGGSAFLALLLPEKYLLPITNLFLLIAVICVLMAIVSMLRTTLKGTHNNLLMLLSLIAFASNFAWWGFFLATGIKIVYYPFDLIIATIAFSSIWFNRYFRILAETEQLAEKLQETNKQKDEFLANTSHELRNPLHGILNISQAVLEREKHSLNAKSVKDLEMAITVGRRMSFMLNDLLDMMRLRQSSIRLQLRSLSIQTIVTGIIDMLRFMTEGKSIRLTNLVPGNFPPVTADENRLIQIVFNLLHNAVKYTNEGEVSIRAEVKDGQAIIVTTDTGIGMDELTMRRVFEPYEQASPDTTATGGGFGLGLSICKQLVELHGGTLQVDSAPGQGSSFAFTLQLSDCADPQLETDAYTAASAAYTEAALTASSDRLDPAYDLQSVFVTDRPRIMAVDDDPMNLTVLENILSLERYDVTVVTNAKDALSMLDLKDWDLIISDAMMPHMSGYELTRAIRSRFSTLELPILLLTARSQPEDIENGFLSGANDYVTKPVDAMELRSRVRSLTEMKKSARDRLRMEAAWLQAQIQPHFLFNTLNTVAALSELDTNRMRKLLEVFGSFLRDKYSFHNADELVPLEYELDLVRAYLYIEKERFEDKLRVVWEVDERVELQIPPLTIQPLVENAIKHGILKRAQGGSIHIRTSAFENKIEISIADDGVGMSEEQLGQIFDARLNKSPGIGLLNTDLRLKRLYGKGLVISSRPDQGTTVSFIIDNRSAAF